MRILQSLSSCLPDLVVLAGACRRHTTLTLPPRGSPSGSSAGLGYSSPFALPMWQPKMSRRKQQNHNFNNTDLNIHESFLCEMLTSYRSVKTLKVFCYKCIHVQVHVQCYVHIQCIHSSLICLYIHALQ